jgi:hypothetical protein
VPGIKTTIQNRHVQLLGLPIAVLACFCFVLVLTSPRTASSQPASQKPTTESNAKNAAPISEATPASTEEPLPLIDSEAAAPTTSNPATDTTTPQGSASSADTNVQAAPQTSAAPSTNNDTSATSAKTRAELNLKAITSNTIKSLIKR